jgi:hypothetical protein
MLLIPGTYMSHFVNQRVKRLLPGSRVRLFAEMLSPGPPERTLGGRNGLCLSHPVTPPPDTSGSEKQMTGPVLNPVPGWPYPRMGKQYYSGPVKGPVCQSGQSIFFCTGNDVHAIEKVCKLWIFLKNLFITAILNLQNSGFWTAPFFRLHERPC